MQKPYNIVALIEKAGVDNNKAMNFRKAIKEDVYVIVQMLSNDILGATREQFSDELPQVYYDAFDRIVCDDNQELIVLENDNRDIIGTLQLSFIQYLTYTGGLRAQVEAVRVKDSERNKGIGKLLINHAIERAKEKGAHLVQLTTDASRKDAAQFYKSLGFKPTHIGMKLHLK